MDRNIEPPDRPDTPSPASARWSQGTDDRLVRFLRPPPGFEHLAPRLQATSATSPATEEDGMNASTSINSENLLSTSSVSEGLNTNPLDSGFSNAALTNLDIFRAPAPAFAQPFYPVQEIEASDIPRPARWSALPRSGSNLSLSIHNTDLPTEISREPPILEQQPKDSASNESAVTSADISAAATPAEQESGRDSRPLSTIKKLLTVVTSATARRSRANSNASQASTSSSSHYKAIVVPNIAKIKKDGKNIMSTSSSSAGVVTVFGDVRNASDAEIEMPNCPIGPHHFEQFIEMLKRKKTQVITQEAIKNNTILHYDWFAGNSDDTGKEWPKDRVGTLGVLLTAYANLIGVDMTYKDVYTKEYYYGEWFRNYKSNAMDCFVEIQLKRIPGSDPELLKAHGIDPIAVFLPYAKMADSVDDAAASGSKGKNVVKSADGDTTESESSRSAEAGLAEDASPTTTRKYAEKKLSDLQLDGPTDYEAEGPGDKSPTKDMGKQVTQRLAAANMIAAIDAAEEKAIDAASAETTDDTTTGGMTTNMGPESSEMAQHLTSEQTSTIIDQPFPSTTTNLTASGAAERPHGPVETATGTSSSTAAAVNTMNIADDDDIPHIPGGYYEDVEPRFSHPENFPGYYGDDTGSPATTAVVQAQHAASAEHTRTPLPTAAGPSDNMAPVIVSSSQGRSGHVRRGSIIYAASDSPSLGPGLFLTAQRNPISGGPSATQARDQTGNNNNNNGNDVEDAEAKRDRLAAKVLAQAVQRELTLKAIPSGDAGFLARVAQSHVYVVRVVGIAHRHDGSKPQNMLTGPVTAERDGSVLATGGWVVAPLAERAAHREENHRRKYRKLMVVPAAAKNKGKKNKGDDTQLQKRKQYGGVPKAEGNPAKPFRGDFTTREAPRAFGEPAPVWMELCEPTMEDVYWMVWQLVGGRQFCGFRSGLGFGLDRDEHGADAAVLGECPFRSPSPEALYHTANM